MADKWRVERRHIGWVAAHASKQPKEPPGSVLYDTKLYCDFIMPHNIQVVKDGVAQRIVDAVNAYHTKRRKP